MSLKTFGKLTLVVVTLGSTLFLTTYLQLARDMKDLSSPSFNMEQNVQR